MKNEIRQDRICCCRERYARKAKNEREYFFPTSTIFGERIFDCLPNCIQSNEKNLRCLMLRQTPRIGDTAKSGARVVQDVRGERSDYSADEREPWRHVCETFPNENESNADARGHSEKDVEQLLVFSLFHLVPPLG